MIEYLPNLGIKGLNTDLAPWDLPPEYMTNGLNFRVSSNAISTYGGYNTKAFLPVHFPGYAMSVQAKSGDFILSVGTQTYAFQTGTNYTQIALKYTSQSDVFEWSGCVNGAIVVLNNSKDYPTFWTGIGLTQYLPWDTGTGQTWRDLGYSAKVIREHRNYLIALNLTDTKDRPSSFRWSHPADTDGIPFTWDPENTAGIAGVQPLGGDGGDILDGLTLRDSFVIYSQKAIHVLDLSGDEFIWRVKDMSATVGLLARNCVVEVKGIHYLITQGDIVSFDGNNIVSIAHDVIQGMLERINTDYVDRSFTYSYDRKKEIWFCVPIDDSLYPDTALIYNWKRQTWSVRELPETSSFMVSAPEFISVQQSWSNSTQMWSDDYTTWNHDLSSSSFESKPFAVNYNSAQLNLLDISSDSTDGAFKTYLERTDLAIGDKISVNTITRLYPHIRGANRVLIRVGSQDRPGGSIRWGLNKLYYPDSERKIDVRSTGALHCYRIESLDNKGFTFAGMDVEYEAAGLRR